MWRARRFKLNAALSNPMCVKACGKLPNASPQGPISSAYSPRWLAYEQGTRSGSLPQLARSPRRRTSLPTRWHNSVSPARFCSEYPEAAQLHSIAPIPRTRKFARANQTREFAP